jgi:hypothetical protein
MATLTPALEERLRAKGFVLLGWGDAGWLQVFSKSKISTLPELQALPIYTAAGDDRMVQWYKQAGFQPRPLAFSDIPTSLATGLIAAVPITPLAASSAVVSHRALHDRGRDLAAGRRDAESREDAWNALSEPDRRSARGGARMQERLRRRCPSRTVWRWRRCGGAASRSRAERPGKWHEVGDHCEADARQLHPRDPVRPGGL